MPVGVDRDNHLYYGFPLAQLPNQGGLERASRSYSRTRFSDFHGWGVQLDHLHDSHFL
jgi:hypothetical protein